MEQTTKRYAEFFSAESLFKNGHPHIALLGRFEDGSKFRQVRKLPLYYFYCLDCEKHNLSKYEKLEEAGTSIDGRKLCKVYTKTFFDAKDNYQYLTKTYEGDLSHVDRYLIDEGLYSGVKIEDDTIRPSKKEIKPRIFFLDIETLYDGTKNEDMTLPITAITIYDTFDKKFYTITYHKDKPVRTLADVYKSKLLEKDIPVDYIYVNDEIELLETIKRFIIDKDPDILTAWNVNFDMQYIVRRLEFYQLRPEDLSPVKKYYFTGKFSARGAFKAGKYTAKENTVVILGRAIIDLLRGFKRLKWNQIESFALENVGQVEFGVGKLDYQGWMKDFYLNEIDRFLEYNIRDVELMLAIDKKYNVMQFLVGLKRISGCNLKDVNYNSRMLDIYILRECNGTNILPSKVYDRGVSDNAYEGGLCLEPMVGLYKNVISLDMKSLYPSIMLSCNMSYETITNKAEGNINLPNGISFSKDTGITKNILINLLGKRDEIRDKMKLPEYNKDPLKYLQMYKTQYAYKTFTNSMYGALAFPSFRLYNESIASSITFMGRWILTKVKDYAEGLGYEIVRGDTDSILIKGDDDIEKTIEIGKKLEEQINNLLPLWCKEIENDASYLQIKFETVYGLFFSSAERKLYAGKKVWDWNKGLMEEIEIKGFASKRSDRSQFSRTLQTNIFKMIFDENTNDEILDYIKREIDLVFDGIYDYEYIGIPKAISKGLDEYKVTNPWIRGIEYSQKNIVGFQNSGKPLLLYVKLPDTDAICFNKESEVPPNLLLDYEKLFETSVINIIKKMCEIIKLPIEQVEGHINLRINNQEGLAKWI